MRERETQGLKGGLKVKIELKPIFLIKINAKKVSVGGSKLKPFIKIPILKEFFHVKVERGISMIVLNSKMDAISNYYFRFYQSLISKSLVSAK